jgi:hypothetical protein
MEGAMTSLVRFLPQSLFGQLIEMGPTLEVAIADNEGVFDVADHPFVLALRLRPSRATRLRDEAIVPGRVEESRMELHRAAPRMFPYGGLLIIDEDFVRDVAQPF